MDKFGKNGRLRIEWQLENMNLFMIMEMLEKLLRNILKGKFMGQLIYITRMGHKNT